MSSFVKHIPEHLLKLSLISLYSLFLLNEHSKTHPIQSSINQPVKVVQSVLGISADWFLVLKTEMCLSNKTLLAQFFCWVLFFIFLGNQRELVL